MGDTELGAVDDGLSGTATGTDAVVRVFVSYRRDDVPDATDRLTASLVGHLGKDHVFLDIDSIEIGARFASVVGKWVARCDVLLAVMGPGWLSATDGDGNRRLDDPKDFVRLEIEAGLTRSVRVVPVLIHGAKIPKASELPESLVPLLDRNAVELTRPYWDLDVEKLIRAIKRLGVEASREAEETRRAVTGVATEKVEPERVDPEPAAAEPAAAEPAADELQAKDETDHDVEEQPRDEADDERIAALWQRQRHQRGLRLSLLNLGVAKSRIADGERVLILARGQRGMVGGLLAVTDRRIIYFTESRFREEFRMEEWDLGKVENADGKRGDVAFMVDGRKISFFALKDPEADGAAVAERINQARAALAAPRAGAAN